MRVSLTRSLRTATIARVYDRGRWSSVAGLLLVGTVVTVLACGCNALFGIHEGAPRPICADTNGSEPLIDDMEDGDGFICALSGHNGHWYTSGDKTPGSPLVPTGGFEPEKLLVPRGTSRYAAHVTGSGFTSWGALMGFHLNEQGVGTQTIDANTARRSSAGI